jgi:hypothetical protein
MWLSGTQTDVHFVSWDTSIRERSGPTCIRLGLFYPIATQPLKMSLFLFLIDQFNKVGFNQSA